MTTSYVVSLDNGHNGYCVESLIGVTYCGRTFDPEDIDRELYTVNRDTITLTTHSALTARMPIHEQSAAQCEVRAMPEQVPQELEDLPPTAKLVDKILEYEGELTQQEFREQAFLSQRTVYNALRELEEIGTIDSYPNSEDLRQTVYYITS